MFGQRKTHDTACELHRAGVYLHGCGATSAVCIVPAEVGLGIQLEIELHLFRN